MKNEIKAEIIDLEEGLDDETPTYGLYNLDEETRNLVLKIEGEPLCENREFIREQFGHVLDELDSVWPQVEQRMARYERERDFAFRACLAGESYGAGAYLPEKKGHLKGVRERFFGPFQERQCFPLDAHKSSYAEIEYARFLVEQCEKHGASQRYSWQAPTTCMLFEEDLKDGPPCPFTQPKR